MRWMLGASLAFVAATAVAQPAAQPEPYVPGERGREVLDKAEKIVTQPARDIGASKTEIPPILVAASERPYDLAGLSTCTQLSAEVRRLTEVLGPDLDTARASENRAGEVAQAGGKAVVNSLIPFRGLVREVSGAAPAQRAMNAALDAGLARRGFLRGVHRAKNCRTAF